VLREEALVEAGYGAVDVEGMVRKEDLPTKDTKGHKNG